MRTGAELIKASKPFATEDRGKTWRLLLTTFAVMGALGAGIIAAPWVSMKVVLSVILGLVNVRLFIFWHDHVHSAILRDSPIGRRVMSLVGFYFMAVRSVWRDSHNYHHKNNAKLIGSSIGSYPVVTLGMWRGMSPKQRFFYAAARHPLTIFFGYFTVFMIGMGISPFRRDPKTNWGAPVSLALHFAALGLLTWLLGWQAALFLLALPMFVACGSGSYLFYAQHNFPDIDLKNRRKWDYTHAALESSSMFDMNPLMHWLTGNIGFHHAHHLNSQIPFYRLPEAMAAMPELQSPGRTTWRLSDVLACLRLDVWDQDAARMVSLRDADVNESPDLTAARG